VCGYEPRAGWLTLAEVRFSAKKERA